LYWAEEKIQHCFEQVSGKLNFLTAAESAANASEQAKHCPNALS